ncbi:adenosylcobinamide kinase/adenosylcobinamide phosphate guanyltransferase [Leminorella grimontii]|uniref:Bifunctional adenosylcobalamin biosynthesis protein n=1 Tax=Leminorella grimontii TaxID=82981 RepID=A0AAV5MYE1_9GAMM|nr:bifunctional adenosylcobinamide kinase/adenosylcobinamide-phosphate guanylyltransferase [Leminorella grimontii]KFC96382.1 adenosylcobinamide-phosphate guanylyltransferase [Leminorella grimontii ATCC 33999 = DSM 5078]GKX54429.1 adenosylcobinamide kinase/adenosylcobinamide phosphate guanyltransferase [Leminorella grimontii]VFS59309.1 Adenosylcobinamide kinase [Leminorella grimontii]
MILITGGARSGKSKTAERLANEAAARLGRDVLYIATALPTDEEMAERIARHRRSRPQGWHTYEGHSRLGDAVRERSNTHSVILLECVTTLLTNLLFDWADGRDPQSLDYGALERWLAVEIDDLLEACRTVDGEVIIVTNELGWGVVPDNTLSRRFIDIAGRVNQKMAERADEVYLTVSGIEVKIKG